MTVVDSLTEVLRTMRSEFRMVIARARLRVRPPTTRQLEIGSGPLHKVGWVTVDMCLGADVYWDLRCRLPFADASFDTVYCSHVLEHFSYPDLGRLLLEVRRVLRRGGQFLIAVPNAALYIDAYRGVRPAAELVRYRPAVVSERPMDVLNYIFYMATHHRFMFDADNLAFHCGAAGFTDCTERAFDAQVDSVARDYESLYMRCS